MKKTIISVVASVIALCALAEEAPEGEGGLKYMDITAVEQAPQRIQKAVSHYWKNVPPNMAARIGIGQVYDFGHGDSSNQLEPALQSFVPLNAAKKPHGEEFVSSVANRGEGLDVTAIIQWQNGVKEGVEKQFHRDGGKPYVTSEIPWKEGEIDGMRKAFFPNGKLRNETLYRKGVPSGPSKTYDADGLVLRESAMKDGKRVGDLKDYWPGTEQLKKVIPYREGLVHGTVRDYYKDGKIKRETQFRDDLMHGEDKHYLPDGTVERASRWKEGVAAASEREE